MRFRSDPAGAEPPKRLPSSAKRLKLRGNFVAPGMALLAGLLVPLAAQAAPPVGYRVALMACPHAGVTAPCLTISSPDGTVYNITGATPKPPLDGRMIRLRATVADKVSACLQGIVLDRIRWTPVRQKCVN
jgi:hypothetical protein